MNTIKNIGFDIGGVLDRCLYHETLRTLINDGHNVYIISAIGYGEIIPHDNKYKLYGFSVGRLYQLGYYFKKHYTECFTTKDYGNVPLTGIKKAELIKKLNINLFIDDNINNLKEIEKLCSNCLTIRQTNGVVLTSNEILTLLK